MSGFVVTGKSKAICAHSGEVQATKVEPRILINKEPIVTQAGSFVISGCKNPPPPANVGPCAAAAWVKGATKVLFFNQPALLMDSQAVCAPTGGSVTEVSVQNKVMGT